MTFLSIITAIFFLLPEIFTLYSDETHVVELTPSNFETEVLQSEAIWMVQFYANYCGPCEKLKPDYIKTSNYLHGIAKVGAIDAGKYKSFIRKFYIRKYPAIKIYGKYKYNSPEDYYGLRTPNKLCKAVIKEIKNTIYREFSDRYLFKYSSVFILNERNYTVVENDKEFWIVIFYVPWHRECVLMSPKWDLLAQEFAGKIKFGAMDVTTNKIIIRHFDFEEFPGIILLTKHQKQNHIVYYNGDFSSQDINRWIKSHVANKIGRAHV